jgi:hypothetical protein
MVMRIRPVPRQTWYFRACRPGDGLIVVRRRRFSSLRFRERALLKTVPAALMLMLAGCRADRTASPAPSSFPPHETVFIDSLQARTFRFFWQLCDSPGGLAPDRHPTRSFASIAATGFALTAYPIGVERSFVSREAARRRVLTTLRFLWTAPQDSTIAGSTGFHGFFYHFLDPETGRRYRDVELSTMDTALLLAGVLFCQSYFDRTAPEEAVVRALADSLYLRADWRWASVRPPTIGHGWTPEGGFLPYDWRGYNEAMLLYLLALGSPTHPVAPAAWSAWTAGYRWGSFEGQEYLGFSPLFGHQYTQVWIDLRGLQDDFMRQHGIDYFENSRRAVLAQRAYALANPQGWSGYGENIWGLTACDGPVNGEFEIDGRLRRFNTYWARGASFRGVQDDGTVCPSATAGSIVFAPEIIVPMLLSLRDTYGERIFSTYGFLDALNPTFRLDVPVQHGRVDLHAGWFDTDYLGIDQGPILAMTENLRSELVWRTLRRNPHIVRGLRAAGFSGGWLDSLAVEP